MPSFFPLFPPFGGRVNSVCAVARSPLDALARSQYPNRQDRDRMFRHDVPIAIPFAVRTSFRVAGTATRLAPLKVFSHTDSSHPTFRPQMFESKLQTTMGRAEQRERPDIGNPVRSAHSGRRQNSRYQVHAEGHSGPD